MSSFANNENEELAIINVLGFIIPVALGAAGAWIGAQSTKAAAWLVSHNVMVKPADALIPITDNAGIDLLRLVALLAVVCTIGFAVARFTPRRDREGKTSRKRP